jgi:hypothetical protein
MRQAGLMRKTDATVSLVVTDVHGFIIPVGHQEARDNLQSEQA